MKDGGLVWTKIGDIVGFNTGLEDTAMGCLDGELKRADVGRTDSLLDGILLEGTYIGTFEGIFMYCREGFHDGTLDC